MTVHQALAPHACLRAQGIINEEFDDGIMSAINFHVRVEKAVGKEGDERVVGGLLGKCLPPAQMQVTSLWGRKERTA